MRRFAVTCLRRMSLALLILCLDGVAPPQAIADATLSLSTAPHSDALSGDVWTEANFVEPGGTTTSNLGTFDIVIQAGSGLSANTPALNAFNRAAALWESFISDPITVTVAGDLADLAPGVLGQAGSNTLTDNYLFVRSQMVTDAANEADDGIVAFLPATSAFSMPAGFSQEIVAGNPRIKLTKANGKALGYTGLDALFGTVLDGGITFNTDFTFDYDNTDGVTTGQFDFEMIAAHEIGHVLGFISDVDAIDALLQGGLLPGEMAAAAMIRPTTLDMFRFDNDGPNDPATTVDFATMPRSMIPGNDEILDQISASYNQVDEVRFSTGVTQGDGRQASHWKDNLTLGIMDPTLAPGEFSPIRSNDVRAFDLIGYEIAAIPEASSYLFVAAAAGVTGIGVLIQRRRNA